MSNLFVTEFNVRVNLARNQGEGKNWSIKASHGIFMH